MGRGPRVFVMSDYLVIAFPNLLSTGFQVTSTATTDYNCIAWAAGDDTWWWPDGSGFGYWPPQSQREETLDAFIAAYNAVGYEPCADGLLVDPLIRAGAIKWPTCKRKG